jgi:hypothetical protein
MKCSRDPLRKVAVVLTSLSLLFGTSDIALVAAATPAAQSSTQNNLANQKCDELAASPTDQLKVGKGVDASKIMVADALPACKEADLLPEI